MNSQKGPTLSDVIIFLILLAFLIAGLDAWAAKEMRQAVEITKDTYLAPDNSEIKGYFITILIAIVGFIAKEIYQAIQKSKDTTSQDIGELKKDVHIILNQQNLILEQLRNKADKIDVTKEILDRVQKEVEYVSRLQGK